VPRDPLAARAFLAKRGIPARVRPGSPEALALARFLRLRLPPDKASTVLRAHVAPGFVKRAARPREAINPDTEPSEGTS
jgi:hypothetical protein